MEDKTLFEIRSDTLSIILNTYNRTENNFTEDVDTLREWMKTQPHLPEVLDDTSLQNFLILNKCSIERAKQKIDFYYTMRSLLPEMYANVNPKLPHMKEHLKISYCLPLPRLTKENYRVIFFKLFNKDMIDIMEPANVIGHIFNVEELRLKEDLMFGDVAVFDVNGLTFNYLRKITPTLLAKTHAIYEKVFSIPLKAIYVVNTSSHTSLITAILSVLKTIMKPKLFQRIYIYEDDSILSEVLSKDVLPKEYGGEGKSLAEIQEILKYKYDLYQDRFDKLDEMRVEESLRPEKLKNDDVLGFYGNFKKIDVD